MHLPAISAAFIPPLAYLSGNRVQLRQDVPCGKIDSAAASQHDMMVLYHRGCVIPVPHRSPCQQIGGYLWPSVKAANQDLKL